MTKQLRKYLVNSFYLLGMFYILNKVRAMFENIFNVSLDGLRWGIWVFGFIVICYVLWRGYVIGRNFDDDSGGW